MATIIPRVSGPSVQVQQGPQVRETTQVDVSGNVRAAQAIAGMGKVVEDYALKQKDINDTTAVMNARRQLSEWEAQTFDPANPEGIGKYKGQNALGANEALIPSLDNKVGEISSTLTPSQRQKFEMVSLNFKDQVQGRLTGYMDREHSAYLGAEQKAAIDNLGQDAVSAGVSGDFGRQDQVANETLAMNRARRTAEGMGEELIKAEERGIVSTIRAQTIDGMMTADPFKAQAYYTRYADQMVPEDRAKVERMLYPVVDDAEATEDVAAIIGGGSATNTASATGGVVHETFDAAMVDLDRTEGGFQNDPADRGNYRDGKLVGTKFGISAKAHPNVDIANLTKEQARAIYKKEYWDAIGADKLPVELRGPAFDTAVNSGVGAAKRLIAASGGDFEKFQTLRRGLQRSIKSNDPTQQKWAGGWEARVAQFEGKGSSAGDAPAAPRTEAEVMAYIRDNYRDPRQRALRMGKAREHFQLEDMRRQESEKAMSEHFYTAIEQGNPRQSLPQLIGADAYAYAVRTGKVEALESMRKRKLEGTFTQDDAVLVEAFHREAVLSPTTFAKRDLYANAGQMSTDTLKEMLAMQKQAKDPTKRAEWATENERIDSGLRVLGLDDSKDGNNKADIKERKIKRDQFAIYYREAARAFTQKNGKAPTPEQADALMRNVVQKVATNPDALRRAGAVEGFGMALPDAERNELVSDFRAAYGRDPTEAEVVNIAARYRIGNR